MRILARQHAGNHEPLGQDGGHVLAAVDRQIDLTLEERVFYFFDEEALPADFRERCLLQAIARRLDDHDLAGRPARVGYACGDGVRLPERELTATRAQSKRVGRRHCCHGFLAPRAPVGGRKRLDASALMMSIVGFIDPSDPRMLATLDAIDREVEKMADDALEWAKASPYPDPATVLDHVYA